MTADDAQVIGFTLGMSGLSTLLIFPFGVALAWLLARKEWPGKSLVETLISLPLVMPPVATGLILLNLLGRRGPIGTFMENTFGTDIVFTWKAVVAAMAVMSFPFLVRTVRLAFEEINPRLEQVARTLGASPARVFRTITPAAGGARDDGRRGLGLCAGARGIRRDDPGRRKYSGTHHHDVGRHLQRHPTRARRPRLSIARNFCRARLRGHRIQQSIFEMGRDAMKLQLKDLRLHQGAFLLQIDLEVTGQVIGIFGGSGAGKTSLLEVVAGLRKPASGFIAVDDLALMDKATHRFLAPEERGVGYVPQDLALFPHLSVRKNLVYGEKSSALGFNLPHVTEVLEIEPLLDRSIADLSGGQKQRVAFARALLASPRLLLMDEPLASLDQELKLKIIPYLKRIRDEFKIPMLYVSHSPDEVIELCDQVLVMREGRCLRISPPEEIFAASTSMVVRPGIYEDVR